MAAKPGLELLALAIRCRAEFQTDNGVFKGKRLVNWLVCYDAVARDKALLVGERLRAGRMFAPKDGSDIALLDSDDLYVMNPNPHAHENTPARADTLCGACGEALSATPSHLNDKDKAREGAGCVRCKRCGEELHALCAKSGAPICVTDARPLSNAAKRASFMIPTEDKEAVISKFAHLRLPPHCTRQTNNAQGPKFVIADVGPDCRPLVVFINRKSGGQQGAELLAEFRELLDPHQVFDLSDGGPKAGLLAFVNVPNHIVLACGGDGTVGWVLGVMDGLHYPHGRPPVAILPLGTGNDLARVMGWGPGYNGEKLSSILYKISRGDVTHLDRWQVRSVPYGTVLPASPLSTHLSSGAAPAPVSPSVLTQSSIAPPPPSSPASPTSSSRIPDVAAPGSPQPSSPAVTSPAIPHAALSDAVVVGVPSGEAPAPRAEAPSSADDNPLRNSDRKEKDRDTGMSSSHSESSLSALSSSGKSLTGPPVPTSPKPRSRRGLGDSAKAGRTPTLTLPNAEAKTERSPTSPSAVAAAHLAAPQSPMAASVRASGRDGPAEQPQADSTQPAAAASTFAPAPAAAPPLPKSPKGAASQLPVVAVPAAAAPAVPGESTIVLNNYMSIGFDADIALQFHEAREANPSHFKSRSINKLWYVKFSTPTLLGVDKLKKHVTLTVDGNSVEIKDIGSLVVLNIPSYTAGADLWRKTDKGFAHPSMFDGKIEVVGLSSALHLGRVQTGVEGAIHLAQGSNIVIKVSEPRVSQIDGEAKRNAAVEYHIKLLNQVPMLRGPEIKKLRFHHHTLSEDELKKVLAQIGDPAHGLRVYDVEYNGVTHSRIFTGRSCVDWIAHHLKTDRDRARHIGGALFTAGHIVYEESHLSTKVHKHLKDDYLYYKFKDNAHGRVPHHQHAHPFLALLKVTVVEAEGVRSLPFSSGPKLRVSLDNQWAMLHKASSLGDRKVYGEDLYFVVSRSDSVLVAEILPEPIGEIGVVRIPIASLEPHTRYDSVHFFKGKSSTHGRIRLALTYRPMFNTRDDGHFFGLPEPHNLPKPQTGHTLSCCSSLVTTLYGLYPDTGKLPVVSGSLPDNLRNAGDVQSARMLRVEEEGRSAERDSLLLPIIEVSPAQSPLENSVQLPPMSPRLPIVQPPPPNSNSLWTQLGNAHVDDKGRFEVALPEHIGSVAGFFRVRCIVSNTVIPGQLFLAPKGASVAIFTVENVLAPDVTVLNDKNGEDERALLQVREGAVALARAWAAKGVLPLYITTHLGTPRWLKNRGFPPGPVSLATFADTLAHLRTHGWLIEAAYVREPEEVRLLREVAMLPAARLFLVSPKDRKTDAGVDLGDNLSQNVLRILREAAPPSKPVPPLCVSW